MSIKALPRLRTVLLLTLLGGTLLLGSSLTATAAAGSKGNPPKLLWKTYPLKQRPTGPTTIPRSARNQRTAVLQRPLKMATRPSLILILSLSLAILLLGVASLPQAAFPNPRVAHAVASWRLAVTAAGVVLFLASVIAVI